MTQLLQSGALSSQKEAIKFFDQLPAIQPDELTGTWRGKECMTGHPMEGLLQQTNWYGKAFFSDGNAHPLVFQKKDGTLFNLNPNFIPAGFPMIKVPGFLVRPALKLFYPFLSTQKPKARLHLVSFRGKVSSAMIYDRLAIIDHFRKIDEDSVLGLMEYKGYPKNKYFFFILERYHSNKNDYHKGVE